MRPVMAELQLEGVTRVHPDGSVAVARLTLHVRNGELLVLVGPSGSGKSTTLRLIAGLEPVTSGTIAIGGRVVNDLEPQERNVAMVFEGESLYPHLTAAGNLRFGLEVGRVPKQEIDLRVQAESRVLGVARLLNRLPRTLSAGQRQRVAVGRATVRVPAVFLLDEPLTHLDAAQRDQLRVELVRLLRGLGVTAIYVTHDQAQAMAIGDRIAVLRGGRLEQVGKPGELYRRPDNTFVASFLGTPGMSLVVARLDRRRRPAARLPRRAIGCAARLPGPPGRGRPTARARTRRPAGTQRRSPPPPAPDRGPDRQSRPRAAGHLRSGRADSRGSRRARGGAGRRRHER